MTDFLHRIRWANLARAAAVLLALALVFAWPKLRSHEAALPPAFAAPLDTTPVEVRTTTVPAPAAQHRAAAKKPRRAKGHATVRRHAPRRRHGSRRIHEAATAAPAPAVPTTPPPAPPPAARAAAAPQASGREFRP
jgi:hypothetical protein